MNRRYLAAATFAGISAVMHLAALPFGGPIVPAIVGAAIWAALALGLYRESRTVAYLGFLMGLFGIAGALSFAMMASAGLLQWVWGSIIVADGCVAVTLFALLWRSAEPHH